MSMYVKGKLLTLRRIEAVKADGRYRSRLVVLEIKRAKPADEKLAPQDVFISIPPIKGLKCFAKDTVINRQDLDDHDVFLVV